MKALKYILLLLLILVVIGAIYLATLDGKYDVVRSRTIKAEPEVVFNTINEYKTWQEWGPWYETDSTITPTYPGKTVGEGAHYSWTSQEGKGTMRTIKVDKPNRIDQEIIFETPMGDMKSDLYWLLEKVEGGTKVTWGMKGEMGFLSRWMAKGMESQIGPMEERGLELMDGYIDKGMKVYSIKHTGVVDYSGGFYLYNTTSSRIDEIGAKYPLMMMKMAGFIKENNVRTTGNPFTIYHKYDTENGTAMYSVGFPVAEKMITPAGSDILSGFMERGAFFKTTLKGSYVNSEEAWNSAYAEVEKLTGFKMMENGEPFEIYVNSPVNTPNPADLITDIYIPVEQIMVE